MKRVFAALALILALMATPGWAQDTPSVKEILTGKVYPLTMKLKQLDDDWVCLDVSGGKPRSGGMAAMLGAMLGFEQTSLYTKGETVKVGEETYLIAYGGSPNTISTKELTENPNPMPEPLTPDTKLSLSLLNLRSAGSLSMIRQFDLQAEIDSSENNIALMTKMYSSDDEKTESSGAGDDDEEAADEKATPQKTGAPKPAARATEDEESDGDTDAQDSLLNLKHLGVALTAYTQDNDNMMPCTMTWSKLKEWLLPYTSQKDEYFTNPFTGKYYGVNTTVRGEVVSDIDKPQRTIVFYETSIADDGTIGVTFCDGSAKRITKAEWLTLKKESCIP